MSKLRIGFFGIAASLLVLAAAIGAGTTAPEAEADITGVFVLGPLVSSITPSEAVSAARATEDFTDQGDCNDAPNETAVGSTDTVVRPAALGAGGIWICVELNREQGNDGTDSADITFDSDDIGKFTQAICTNQDGDSDWFESGAAPNGDNCRSTEGLNTDELIVDCTQQLANPIRCSDTTLDPDQGAILVLWLCPTLGGSTTITITSSDAEGTVDSESFRVQCRGNAGGITLTATPTTVEIVPAVSNTAHSLIQLTVTDAAGTPILVMPSTDVDFTTDRCAIEESNVDSEVELLEARANVAALSTALPSTYFNWNDNANEDPFGTAGTSVVIDATPGADNTSVFDINLGSAAVPVVRSMAAAILHCDPHSGITNATPGVATIQACIEVPDAADICRTVTVTVIGPPASITVAASPTSLRCGEKATITVTVKDSIGQNVSDHTVVELVTNLGGTIGGTGGVLSFIGPVVPISSNGAGTFGGVATAFLLTSESHSGPYEVVATTGGTLPGLSEHGHIGIFSTPPISAQVTVTCTIPAATAVPAATITAPRTGTGITPPNTGDGGLTGSSSSWTLFALGGLAAFAIAGLATAKFARR